MPSLEIKDLNVRYGSVTGTNDLSFRIEPGEIVSLIGANGAGKSSTLKAILGLAAYPSGTIKWGDRSLGGLKPEEIVTLGISYSPEGRRVFPRLSVEENLEIGGFTRTRAERRRRKAEVYEYFPRLEERRRQDAGSLSGGEQQMLAIGRALMSFPKLFLLDEPSLGLAPIIVERIGEVIKGVQSREGMTVILAEQNAFWALTISSRAIILELGRRVLDGPADQLLHDDAVKRAFLGVG